MLMITLRPSAGPFSDAFRTHSSCLMSSSSLGLFLDPSDRKGWAGRGSSCPPSSRQGHNCQTPNPGLHLFFSCPGQGHVPSDPPRQGSGHSCPMAEPCLLFPQAGRTPRRVAYSTSSDLSSVPQWTLSDAVLNYFLAPSARGQVAPKMLSFGCP